MLHIEDDDVSEGSASPPQHRSSVAGHPLTIFRVPLLFGQMTSKNTFERIELVLQHLTNLDKGGMSVERVWQLFRTIIEQCLKCLLYSEKRYGTPGSASRKASFPLAQSS